MTGLCRLLCDGYEAYGLAYAGHPSLGNQQIVTSVAEVSE